MGHSDNPNDLMYAMKDDGFLNWYGSLRQSLSMRDLNTLVLLYRLEPTISNVQNLKSESFYYPPLVIGENDLLLQKKLQELQSYISNYPDIAAGYINISAVYSDMGDFEQSLKSLSEADKRAKTQDEQYLVAYNRSITYYNLQNYNKALEFANIAKSIKDTRGAQELIAELSQLLSR
jgi:tetratricopeptide (TPR) repeat protein